VSETSIASLIAHFPASEHSVAVINPANAKKIYDLPQLSREQVIQAVSDGASAQQSWSQTPVFERAKILLRLHDLVLDNQDKLLDLLQLETGKARAHAFEELSGAIAAPRYYGKVAGKTLVRKRSKAGVPILTKTYVDHVPVGVVGIITPCSMFCQR
jgi:succinate-semialdehyde dehydrogenase/glutarate-semialdehyde dehydrogenase